MFDCVKERSKRTFPGILATICADTEITEREREIELEVMISGVFLGHRHLSAPTITRGLIGRAEPQI